MTTWRLDRPYRWPWLRWLYLWWWELREREVDDVYTDTAGSKGVPSYNHGKVSGLTPDQLVMTETTESPYVCCGYCSAGMVVHAARKGVENTMGATAHPIRNQGGRPHDNGSKASELRAGARAAFGVELEALAVAEIPERLRAGFAVVVNLDYAELPGWLKTQGGSFGHSCALFGWREDGDLVGFLDPLWSQAARGAWVPWSQVRPALWADGEHSGAVTRWEVAEPAPAPEPEPEPEPEPCPPPDVTQADVDQAELDAIAATTVARDRSWRSTTGLEQPYLAGAWGATSWSTFARWGPELPPGSWSGPDATWDGTSWVDARA